MLTKQQHSILVKGIEELALEHLMYHVEKDRYLFDYSPAIVNYHKCLISGNVNETFKYDYFIYDFDTMLAENVDINLFNHSNRKYIKKLKNISDSITNRFVNGYIFKPNHIYESLGVLKIDWNKFDILDHIRFLKESIAHEVISFCDFRHLQGFYDGSHHLIKESKNILNESNSMGCGKKSYKYAKRVFENVKKEVDDILTSNGFIVENIYNAGSLRRKKSVIGDLDLIVNVIGHKHLGKINRHPLKEKQFIENYSFLFGNTIKRNIDSEQVKVHNNMIQFIKEDMQCDIFFCTPTSIATKRCYWTGSAAHNVKMLYEGFKKDILFSFDYMYDKNKEIFLIPKNERNIFSILGIDYVKPEDRT